MMNHLPEAFVNRMRKQLGNELSAFLRALDDPPVRGIRLNPFKLTQSTFEYIKNVRIPWAENGYYLPLDSNVGSSIFHAAGAYYIQEPGAMLPASVLNAKLSSFDKIVPQKLTRKGGFSDFTSEVDKLDT